MTTGEPEAARKRLVSGLIEERKLFPRASKSSNLVRQFAEALRAGVVLPPIVVERETSRIVDGFHRVEASKKVYGPEALIDVVERDYADEAEMFLDVMRLNSAHGSRLAPYDQLRCIGIAQELSIDPARVAGALSVTPSYLGELSSRRLGTELTTRSPIPLKRTIEHMKGRPLTTAQMEANQKLGGQSQAFYLNQLNLLIENGLLDLEDSRVRDGLRRLKENLDGVDVSEPKE